MYASCSCNYGLSSTVYNPGAGYTCIYFCIHLTGDGGSILGRKISSFAGLNECIELLKGNIFPCVICLFPLTVTTVQSCGKNW